MDASRRFAVQESNGRIRDVATRLVIGHQRAADDASPEHHALQREERRIGRRAKVGEHPLVRVVPARRIRPKGQVEDGRVAGKARAASHDLLQGQIIGPAEREPVVKSREVFLELSMPECAELIGAHHHEHLPGLGQQLQDLIDELRDIVRDRDRGLVLPEGRVAQKPLIDSGEQKRRIGKELLAMLARKDRGRARESDDQVRLGTGGVHGANVIDDRLLRRPDKPCGTHHDLNDIDGSSDALLQVDPKIGGQVVIDQNATFERLQQQDLPGRGRRLARRRTESKQGRQHGASPSVMNAEHLTE